MTTVKRILIALLITLAAVLLGVTGGWLLIEDSTLVPLLVKRLETASDTRISYQDGNGDFVVEELSPIPPLDIVTDLVPVPLGAWPEPAILVPAAAADGVVRRRPCGGRGTSRLQGNGIHGRPDLGAGDRRTRYGNLGMRAVGLGPDLAARVLVCDNDEIVGEISRWLKVQEREWETLTARDIHLPGLKTT